MYSVKIGKGHGLSGPSHGPPMTIFIANPTRTELELGIFYIHRIRTEPELRFFKINRTRISNTDTNPGSNYNACILSIFFKMGYMYIPACITYLNIKGNILSNCK